MNILIPKYFTGSDLRIIGIYFLLRRGVVVYIGQTINMFNRIREHKEKVFDNVRLISCSPEQLDFYERRLIRIFKPKYNLMTYEQADDKTRSIRIPKEVDKKLQKRAKTQGRSVNSQIVYEIDQK